MFKQYINGKCVEGKGKTSAVYNPATDEVVGEVSCANAEQATEALLAAEKAFETWSKTPVNERANWMYKLRDECVKERDKLVELIKTIYAEKDNKMSYTFDESLFDGFNDIFIK